MFNYDPPQLDSDGDGWGDADTGIKAAGALAAETAQSIGRGADGIVEVALSRPSKMNALDLTDPPANVDGVAPPPKPSLPLWKAEPKTKRTSTPCRYDANFACQSRSCTRSHQVL